MKFFRKAAVALMSLAPALFVGGCNDNTSAQTGPLTVKLTDAPFPYDSVVAVNIFVVRVDAKQSTTDTADANSNVGNGSDHGWLTVATPNQVYNLLDFTNGGTATLGQTALPVGQYRGFRLIIDPAQSSIVLKDGTVLTGTSNPGVKFPSAARTGIKVNLVDPVEVTTAGTSLIVDFDVGRSFVMRGAAMMNGLLFTPVLRGTVIGETGQIAGTIRANDTTFANATVEVLVDGTPIDDTVSANVIATTHSDSTGKYLAAFLLPGTYSVRATPPSGSPLGKAIVSGIVVTADALTSGVDLTLH